MALENLIVANFRLITQKHIDEKSALCVKDETREYRKPQVLSEWMKSRKKVELRYTSRNQMRITKDQAEMRCEKSRYARLGGCGGVG